MNLANVKSKKASVIAASLICVVTVLLTSCSQPCTLRLEQSPELRGFRLGMSVEQIQNKFRGLSIPPANEFGLATVIIDSSVSSDEINPSTAHSFVNASRYPEFSGVRRIYLEIVDGSLASIKVFYENEPKWNSVDEFVSRTSEALKLNGSWKEQNEDYKSLGCNDFLVYTGIKRDYQNMSEDEKMPFVELNDFMKSFKPTSRKMDKNDNQKQKEEERRKTFNP